MEDWMIRTICVGFLFGWCSCYATENWSTHRIRSVLAIWAGALAVIADAFGFHARF